MKSFSAQAQGLLAIGAICVGALSAVAGPGAAYDVRLAIQSRNAGAIQGRGVPMINDFTGGLLGLFPNGGPHLIADDPTFYSRHQTKFIADMDATVADVNFPGVIVLDYEAWWPSWEWSPIGVQNSWDNYIRTKRTDLLVGKPQLDWPGIIQNEYKKEVRKYYEFTINLAKSLRPKAKVSVYGMPLRSYWIFSGVPQYGFDLNGYRQLHEQQLGWYFDLVDVICPSIYPVYKVGTPASGNIHDPAANEAYILGMVSESVRNSRGKPVYPFFTLKYHISSGHPEQFINAINLRQGLELPRQAGAAGVAIWDFFYTDEELNAWQNYFDTTARDHINNVIYPGVPTNFSSGATFSTTVSEPPPRPTEDDAVLLPGTQKVND